MPLSVEGLLFGIPAINARLFRSSALRKIGPIRTNIGLGADREFLLRLLRSGATGVNLPEPLYFYRNHIGSATMSGDQQGYLRVYRSDLELARGLVDDQTVAPGQQDLVTAFTALARVKLKRIGDGQTEIAATRLARTSVIDAARGVWLNRKWRGRLSGY